MFKDTLVVCSGVLQLDQGGAALGGLPPGGVAAVPCPAVPGQALLGQPLPGQVLPAQALPAPAGPLDMGSITAILSKLSVDNTVLLKAKRERDIGVQVALYTNPMSKRAE